MGAQRQVIERAGQFPCPLLVVHGDDDRIASIAAIQSFYDGVQQKDRTRVVYPGAQHEPHNELQKQEVLALYRDWILARA